MNRRNWLPLVSCSFVQISTLFVFGLEATTIDLNLSKFLTIITYLIIPGQALGTDKNFFPGCLVSLLNPVLNMRLLAKSCTNDFLWAASIKIELLVSKCWMTAPLVSQDGGRLLINTRALKSSSIFIPWTNNWEFMLSYSSMCAYTKSDSFIRTL